MFGQMGSETMKRIQAPVLPGLLATTVIGVGLLPVQPAAALPDIVRDIGIGAATSVVTGVVTDNGSVVENAVGGAASGAAVSATRDVLDAEGDRSAGGIARDAGVGAAASVITGEVTNNGSILGNVIKGAATGALINILD